MPPVLTAPLIPHEPAARRGFISVVIPAKNAAGILPACLRAAAGQAPLRLEQDYEIILVDDGSSDETAEVARKMGVRVIHQANTGPAGARNTGARAARGEILAFTDADCVPSPGWLAALTSPFNDPAVSGVKGVYLTGEKGLVPRFVQMEYAQRYQFMAGLERIDFIDTYSAAYRRDIFLRAGGFNQKFPVPSVEDQELSFRLASSGLRLVFQPQAAVYHRHDLTIREYALRKYGIGYWKAVMLRWMPERAFKDTYTPPALRWQIILAALGPLGLIGGIFWAPAAWLAAACLLLFILTTLPFMVFAARRDPPLGPILLPMLILRAYALGCGLAAGILLGAFKRD